ncbi:MAG: carboxypeptidase-like regulatory domain-containing protein, partial [Holophagales bacterium]|nr:carboxypeptidase-like regulatory domain-containing protein [Holophagales bacterium]
MYKPSALTIIPAIAILQAGSASVNHLWSQTTASIRLLVIDKNGVPIPGRRIVLESPERSIQRTLTTNNRGEAVAAGLMPGVYNIEGSAIQVKADERALVRVRLLPSEATVVVEASPLFTETSSVGVQTTFLPQDLERLPLPVHRYVEYSYLAPGISPSGRPEPVVLGSMLDSNAFVIDGMPTNLSSTGRFGL